MKRLFKVVNSKGNRVYAGNAHEYNQSPDGYFSSKVDAKILREDLDKINTKTAPHTIRRGPDHWRGES